MNRREFLAGAVAVIANGNGSMTDVTLIRPPTGAYDPASRHTAPGVYVDGSPISLTATATLQAASSRVPNNIALKNPTPDPIEINEINFHGHSAGLSIEGGAIGFKLELANVGSVSDNFVPMWLFDRSTQLYTGETIQDVQAETPDNLAETNFTWKLKTPLYLLPGETLTASFAHYGLIPEDITVDITYRGRVIVGHPRPATRVMPFIAVWQGDSIDLSFVTAEADTLVTAETDSTENDLINSQNESVTVNKMVGRLLTLPNQTDGTQLSDQVQPIIDQIFDVNLRTSHGFELTKDFFPFRLVFAVEDRSFPGGFTLHPGDYVMAQVRASQNGIAPLNVDDTLYWPTIITPVIPQIALIGERTVTL